MSNKHFDELMKSEVATKAKDIIKHPLANHIDRWEAAMALAELAFSAGKLAGAEEASEAMLKSFDKVVPFPKDREKGDAKH